MLNFVGKMNNLNNKMLNLVGKMLKLTEKWYIKKKYKNKNLNIK